MASIDDLPNEVLECAFLCLHHLPDKIAVIGVSKRWREIGVHARNLWRTTAPEPLWLPLWMAHHLCLVVPRGLSVFIDISAVASLSLVQSEDELQNIARACEGLRIVDCPQDYKSRIEPFVDNLMPFTRALAGSNSQLRQLHVPPELVISLHELVPQAFQSVLDYRPEPYPIAENKKAEVVTKKSWATAYQDFVHACALLPRLASVSASELWLMDKNTGRPNYFIAHPDARYPCLRVIELADHAINEPPLWIQFLQRCPLLERANLGIYSPQAIWPADVQLQDLPPLRDIMYHYTPRGYAFSPIFPERPLPNLERLRVLNWFPDATRDVLLSRVLQHTPRLQSLTLEMTTGRSVPFSALLSGCLRLMAHDGAAEMENLLRVAPLLTRVECVGRREYREPPSRCLVRLKDVIFGEVTDAMHVCHYFSSPSWDIDPSQFDRMQAQETSKDQLVTWHNQTITRAAESTVVGAVWDVSIKITLQRLPREEGKEWLTELAVEIVHSRQP